MGWFRLRPIRLVAKIRSQLSTIFSKTGSASDTELLITFSTSAEARCCSSASFVSLSKRVFSMAMTAWGGEVLDEFDLLVSERSNFLAVDNDGPG